MAVKKIALPVGAAAERLDQWLSEALTQKLGRDVSRGKARKLIVAGAVYLNSTRVRIASKPLRAGAKVEVYLDAEKLFSDAAAREVLFELTEAAIVFEDEALLVVNKPAGVPTQPTLDEARTNVFGAAKAFLAKRSGTAVSAVYLALHHRLDRDTSGLLLLAKSKDANPGVAKLFAEHRIQKTYWAISTPTQAPRPRWVVENHLGKLPSSKGGKRARFGAVRSGGDPAVTEFDLRGLGPAGPGRRLAWIEARPKTGRTHQIRVHLSEGGLPILGDPFYGGLEAWEGVPVQRVLLHATRLEFEHPLTGQSLRLECPPPDAFEAYRRLCGPS